MGRPLEHPTRRSNSLRDGRSSHEDEDEWQTVRRRSKHRHDKFRNNFPQATTFYVNNIPEGVTNHKLWTTFQDSGDIVDAFVARKKDKAGNFFGFIRFNNIKNPGTFSITIQNKKCNGAVLGVFPARFDRDGNPINPSHVNPTNRNHHCPKTPSFVPTHHSNLPPPQNHNHDSRNRPSFREILTGRTLNPTGNQITINLPPKNYALPSWSERAIIATVNGIGTLNSLNKILTNNLNVENFHLAYIGGLKILITLPSKALASEFLTKHTKVFPSWFTRIGFWNKSDTTPERIAILKIYGLPIPLWHKEVSNLIGKQFGKLLEESIASPLDGSLLYDKVTVITGTKKILNQQVSLSWRSRSFNVVVSEEEPEWFPPSLKVGNHTSLVSTESPEMSPDSGMELDPITSSGTRKNSKRPRINSPSRESNTTRGKVDFSKNINSKSVSPTPHHGPTPISPTTLPNGHNSNSPILHACMQENQPTPQTAPNEPIRYPFSFGPFPSNSHASRKRVRTKSPSTVNQTIYPINLNLNFPPPYNGNNDNTPISDNGNKESTPIPENHPISDTSSPINPDNLPPTPSSPFPPSLAGSLVIPETQAGLPNDPPFIFTQGNKSSNSHEVEATLNIAAQLGISLEHHIDQVNNVISGEGEKTVDQ